MVAAKWEQKAFLKREPLLLYDGCIKTQTRKERQKGGENEGDLIYWKAQKGH